jgi:hypothetical protein
LDNTQDKYKVVAEAAAGKMKKHTFCKSLIISTKVYLLHRVDKKKKGDHSPIT